MATKVSKKPGSLVDKNKDFMANFSYDMLNKKQPPAPIQPPAPAQQPVIPSRPTQMPNTDVVDTFNGLKQQATPQGYKRPVTRRGMSGAELDANGNDPGSGMNWFDKNNSPAQVDARNARQAVLDQRRGAQMAAAGASAVAERKALQEMGQAPFQLQEANRAANSVKGNDGYMTLFDGKGNAVGTNRPPAQPKNWAAENAAYGGGDLSSTNPKNPNLQAQIQQGFNQDAQKPRPMGPPKPSSPNFLDSYATPGGSPASVVGAPSAPGTPVGGNSFLDTPSAPTKQNLFFNEPQPIQGPMPSMFSQLPANAGPQTQLPPNMGPRSQPSPAMMGPAPQFNQEQQAALNKLQGLGNFSARVGDLYPGNDYDYLKMLFPQVDTRKYPTTNNLLDAYRNLGR